MGQCTEFAWPRYGSRVEGSYRVVSVRGCQKLPPCLSEPMGELSESLVKVEVNNMVPLLLMVSHFTAEAKHVGYIYW